MSGFRYFRCFRNFGCFQWVGLNNKERGELDRIY